MTGSYCPKCNKEQPAIDAGMQGDGGTVPAGTQYYQCAICRTPVGAPRHLVQPPAPAAAGVTPWEIVASARPGRRA